MTVSSSSRSRGGSSSRHTPEPTPTPTTMDYEQDEQEEQIKEQAEEPQAENMDEDDAPYLDLQDDRERQAYAMIKNRSFGHTRAFDPDLLEKTGMDVDVTP